MAAQFATTQWSVVLRAREAPEAEAREALSQLCETYWYPIHALVRRTGWDRDEAQDLTQAYFTRLLEKTFLDSVRPEAGRFRSFLLASLKHFLANEWDKQKAQKRGGHLKKVPLPEYGLASRTCQEAENQATPEEIFEAKWAQTLSERALSRLQSEWDKRGNSTQFRFYEGFLTASRPQHSYEELAARLSQSKGTTRVVVHRLRQRYVKLLREEIAETVRDDTEVEDELRHVLEVLADSRSARA